MYLVKIYGYDPDACPDALLEEAEFTHGINAVAYIAGEEGTGRRAELFACPGWIESDHCNCGAGPSGYYGMHERHCGLEPCPHGCPFVAPGPA